MNQRLLRTGLVFMAAALVTARTGFAQGVIDLLPNLAPRPASEISVVQDATNGHILLRFAAVNTNIGIGPVELVAGAVTSSGQQVYQRVYRSDGSYYDTLAGTFTYHPEHDHFHFNGFALYTLTPVGSSPTSGVTSEKTSFCVEDTTPINLTLPGAPQSPVYMVCSPPVQGLSVGWGDRYGPTLAGQSFDITGDPEADYDLKIQTDPYGKLAETNESDNSSCIRLHVNPGARTVQVLGVCGNVTITSITPNSGRQGTTVNVQITGTGFAPGMAVGFENGSGPVPVIGNVVVVNQNTITARVSIKNGGGKQPRVWDLRVGSGTLMQAFTVRP